MVPIRSLNHTLPYTIKIKTVQDQEQTKSIATVTLYVALHPSKLNHLFNLMLPDMFMLVCSPHICTIDQVVVHHTLVTNVQFCKFKIRDN